MSNQFTEIVQKQILGFLYSAHISLDFKVFNWAVDFNNIEEGLIFFHDIESETSSKLIQDVFLKLSNYSLENIELIICNHKEVVIANVAENEKGVNKEINIPKGNGELYYIHQGSIKYVHSHTFRLEDLFGFLERTLLLNRLKE